jgi:hypothetical protein
MKFNLKTRTFNDDYDFLCSSIDTSWRTGTDQLPDYRDVTIFEKPSIILQSYKTNTQTSWRLYISGIPSKRKDFSKTIIGYAAAFEGEAGEPMVLNALNLISIWINDISSIDENNINWFEKLIESKTTKLFDKFFDQKVIDECVFCKIKVSTIAKKIPRLRMGKNSLLKQ